MLINKRHHNPGNRGNCLMMHVVYFRRTYYGTELWVPTMGNQGSTDYLFSCQLSGQCPDYGATLVVFSCGAVVFSY